jgi:hypothetical protein
VPYPGNSPGFLFSLEKREEEEEIPCISLVIWIFAVDYIDIVGVRSIFVQQQQETVVVHLIGKWDCREEREARWEVVRQVLYPN